MCMEPVCISLRTHCHCILSLEIENEEDDSIPCNCPYAGEDCCDIKWMRIS